MVRRWCEQVQLTLTYCHGARAGTKADLLGVLVAQPDLNDVDIRSILFDVVIAGSDTTASTTTAALYILHRPENAEWLERARDEAIRCTEDGGAEKER